MRNVPLRSRFAQSTLFAILLATGCTGKISLQQYRADFRDGTRNSLPPELARQDFRLEESHLAIGDEVVVRAPQRVGTAIVEDAYLQKIMAPDGRLKYVVSDFDPAAHGKLLPRIAEMEEAKGATLQRLKDRYETVRTAIAISPLEIVIKRSLLDPTVYYQIEFVPHDGSSPQRWTFTPRLSIIKKFEIQSSFDAKAWIYPRGPHWSAIGQVPLHDLDGAALKNSLLRITTYSDREATATDDQFKFETTDPRFDQVQVFYFVQWGFELFRQQFGVSLTRPLEVKTHVGAPRRSNTMLYFHGNILFGEGDGHEYRNIMRDPTIVLHETSHAFIDAIAGLASEGESGSINEGFADYFVAHFLDHSKLGETAATDGKPVRDVANDLKLDARNGKLYHDSLIVSGMLWDLRRALGPAAFSPLVPKILARIGARGNLADLSEVIKSVLESELSGSRKIDALAILKERAWIP